MDGKHAIGLFLCICYSVISTPMLVYLIPLGKNGRQLFLCRTQRYSMERLEIINFIWWRVRNSFPDIVIGMYDVCSL